MNTSEGLNRTELRYFHLEPSPIKSAILALAIVLLLLAGSSLYSIIWYERYGCDLKRTLGNRLVSLMCWVWIESFIITFFFEIVIYSYGQLPSDICALYIYMKNVFAVQGILLLDGIILSRFVLIFYIKNPGVFQGLNFYLLSNQTN